MKNLFKSLMLVAVAAMAFTACQNDIEEVNAVNKSVTLTFNAGFGEDTRVDFAEAGNKAYKASWEVGDTVTFAVYSDADNANSWNQPIEVAQTIEITEAADSVELTVSFNNLTAGNVIKAYVNYTVNNWGSSSSPWWAFDTSYNAQKPDANGPSEVYASAAVEYAAGVDYADLTFAHDYAYGLMTIKDLPFEADYFEFYVNGSYQPTTVYLNNVTDNKVWFYIDEYEKVYDLEVRIVSKDYTQQRYFVRSFGEADTFAFTKGRVSRFTIDKWYTKLATPQNVKGELNGEKIVFTWDAVENADSYDVVVEYNYQPTEYEVETNRLELDAKGLGAFAGLDIEVVAVADGYVNSNSASAEFIVPVAKDDEGTHNFIYDAVEVVDVYANTYKFYQKENADNFMYLSFRQALPTSGSVVYDFDDIETYPYARSCFWMSSDLRPAGKDGFTSSYVSDYNIDHNVYTIYPNDGDACAIYVDVEDGKYAITAFVKNNSYFGSENLFKGSFNGPLSVKETLATPANLEAVVDGYSVTLSWNKVDGATSYEVNFAGETKEVTTTSAKFDGVAVGYHSATVVAKAEGYNDSEAAILNNIEVKQVFETVEIASVVAGTVDGNYTPLTLTTVKGDVFTTKAGNGGVNYLAEGTWDYNNWYDTGYALGNVYLNGDTWVSSFVMEVKYVEGKYELTIQSSAGNFHFLGDITGLVVPGYEPEVPEYDYTNVTLTSAVATHAASNYIGGTGYDITFTDGTTTIVCQVQTKDKTYLKARMWDQTVTNSEVGYLNNLTWTGVSTPWPYEMDVKVVDGQYNIAIKTFDFYVNGQPEYNATFVGQIEGFTLPVEEEEEEPVVGLPNCENLTLQLCKKDGFISGGGTGYGDIRLVDSEGKYYINVEVNDNPLYTHNYVCDGNSPYDPGTIYSSNTYVSYKGVAWDDETADTPAVVSGTFDIVVDGGNCTIDIDFVLEDGNKFSGSYAGVLPY